MIILCVAGFCVFLSSIGRNWNSTDPENFVIMTYFRIVAELVIFTCYVPLLRNWFTIYDFKDILFWKKAYSFDKVWYILLKTINSSS